MMRTELDLRQCYAERAAAAPDGAAVLARLAPDRRRRTRHALLPLAVAAGVALIVAVTAALWGGPARPAHDRAGAPVAVATDPVLFRYGYRLDDPPGPFEVASRNVSTSSTRVVYDAGRAPGAIAGTADVLEAVIYRRGVFDPRDVRTGSALSVHGVPGFYGPAIGHVVGGTGPDGDGLAPSVAWQYAPDSWAVVTGTTAKYQTRAAELGVAETVHPGGGAEVRVPFVVGRAPDGLAATRIDTSIDGAPYSASVGYGAGSTVTIDAMYVPGQQVNAALGNAERRLTVDGHPAGFETLSGGVGPDGHLLVIVWGTYVVRVSGEDTVSTDELVAIAKGLTVTRSGDPATWTPAATALG